MSNSKENTQQKPETLVIGLDSASWDVLNPLIHADKLPNIKQILKNSQHGQLKSTMPPMTAPAWTSIATGVSPCDHGIYGFREQDPSDFSISPSYQSESDRPKLWDMFNLSGRDIGVINYPLVYPASENAEFFVSGFPSPQDQKIAYPKKCQQLVSDSGFRTKPLRNPANNRQKYFEEVKMITESQKELTLELAHEYRPELVFSVFMGLDWAHHYLWNKADAPGDLVESMYIHMDEIIGELVESIEGYDNVIIISDHGVAEIDGEIHMNKLLENQGFVKRKSDQSTAITWTKNYIQEWIQDTPSVWKQQIKKILPNDILEKIRYEFNLGPPDLQEKIDWEGTTAYTYGAMGKIYINANEKRELEEIVKNYLENITHPEKDENVFSKVVRFEEYYDSNCSKHSPDLIAIPKGWRYTIYGDFADEWIHQPKDRFADHDPEGIFILDINSNNAVSDEYECTSILALLLSLHNLPLPEYMDSSLAEDVIDDLEYTSEEFVMNGEDNLCKSGVDEEIRTNLEDLGYM